ncbi:MAG TPA: hypothetical protein DCE41_29975 [Cytophagales bacterium]|nr:hypothetical protein [Cytophagales bacterium]HAA18094.1 hypothetical protein [Cytophagales bacterium]HAP59879.1 hypothetical protein [Cytophagales bacterium]
MYTFLDREHIAFASYNGKDPLGLSIQDIFWVQAQGNYVKCCWAEGEEVCTTLLRNTFTAVRKQLPDSFTRTHRYFMVNLHHLRNLT